MFSVLFQATRGALNSVIFTAHFSGCFSSVFNEKNRETFLYVCSIACKKRRTN